MPKKEDVKKEERKTAFVYIAKDPLNPFEEIQQVSINERVYNIVRGATVEVPLEVAKLLKDTGIIDDYR